MVRKITRWQRFCKFLACIPLHLSGGDWSVKIWGK